jgi:rhamnogalacturonan endolyase
VNRNLLGISFLAIALLGSSYAFAQRQMEYLNRGLVAVNKGEGKVFLSWRMLGTEAASRL